MDAILPPLAFFVLIAAQCAGVAAVHAMKSPNDTHTGVDWRRFGCRWRPGSMEVPGGRRDIDFASLPAQADRHG
jgi:hypothetical protein